jgi:uncharacterized membrane protein YhaH (DUF805 family)
MVQLLFFSIGFALVALGPVVLSQGALPLVTLVTLLAMIWPQLAVAAQRLHDIGASGWWQLLNAVPVVNVVLFLVLLLAPGQDYDNRFGPRPSATAARLPATAV